MPASPFPAPATVPPPPAAGWLARLHALRPPAPRWEALAWLLVAAWIIGMRLWTAHCLPTYVWTRDSGSYVTPALDWLEGGGSWVTNPRRGPVYSLFLAGIFKLGGTLGTVANVQAALGALTLGVVLLAARAMLGRGAFWPLYICAWFLALYGLPLEVERLVRNETLLTLFATGAFGAWYFALLSGRVGWFALSGLSTGLMHLLKPVFPVYPPLVLLGIAWTWRRRPARAAGLGAVYLALFLLPTAGSRLYDRLSGTRLPPEPEAGQMFYGRTAQWTWLEGGLAPEVKARIRGQVEEYAGRYRRTGELNNNDIVKRTVVPSLKTILVNERGGRTVDVDRFCWRLGLEAVAHHPGEYARQVLHDFFYLNFISAHRFILLQPRQLTAAARDARAYQAERGSVDGSLTARVFDLPAMTASTRAGASKNSATVRFARFVQVVGRVRLLSPVFLTSLTMLTTIFLLKGRERTFWLGMAALWFYYLFLLSTVGRPLDRYLLPMLPVVFWASSRAAVLGWQRLRRANPVPKWKAQSPTGSA